MVREIVLNLDEEEYYKMLHVLTTSEYMVKRFDEGWEISAYRKGGDRFEGGDEKESIVVEVQPTIIVTLKSEDGETNFFY